MIPVSADGQTAVHTSMGFNHAGRVDIALSPDQPEGVWLMRYLEKNHIPYYAFRSAVAHKATGAHIHLGPGSTKLVAGNRVAEPAFNSSGSAFSMRVLIIDNYDSFTWNLAHAAARSPAKCPSWCATMSAIGFQIAAQDFDSIVISPGPGHPEDSRDFGVSADVIRCATVPVLGVCLGHQGIALALAALSRVWNRPMARLARSSTMATNSSGECRRLSKRSAIIRSL